MIGRAVETSGAYNDNYITSPQRFSKVVVAWIAIHVFCSGPVFFAFFLSNVKVSVGLILAVEYCCCDRLAPDSYSGAVG